MAKVSITSGLYKLGAAHKYAQCLAHYLQNDTPYWCFGSHGGFEKNYDAMAANIRKIHVKLDGEKPWPTSFSRSERTCNNYLVYTQHLYFHEHFQIIGLIYPNNAHEMADILLPGLIVLAEEFIECDKSHLDKLKTYDA